MVYVDDTLLYADNPAHIDEAVQALRDRGMVLEEEDSVAGFLGVHIDRDDQGRIFMTQKGLIKRIIEALNISHLPPKYTPCKREPLTKDLLGDPCQATWNYASVIGMLQYLQAHSRPDLTYAVCSAARFVHSPRRSHEIAVERIGQYLKMTANDGLYFDPTDDLNVNCFVDTDFAGLWPHEEAHDEDCVKSRVGYAITVSGCPLIWKSRLLNDIAMSTCEAEYSGLSLAMKALLPVLYLVNYTRDRLGLTEEQVSTMDCTVHEDNAAALTIANLEPGRTTARTKYYAIKLHWFRSKLKKFQNGVCDIVIQKIDTTAQKADILTKGLVRHCYENIRRLLCGWTARLPM